MVRGFCSLDGKPVWAMEFFSVNVDMLLAALDKEEIRSFILPGGNIPEIDTPEVKTYLQALKKRASAYVDFALEIAKKPARPTRHFWQRSILL